MPRAYASMVLLFTHAFPRAGELFIMAKWRAAVKRLVHGCGRVCCDLDFKPD